MFGCGLLGSFVGLSFVGLSFVWMWFVWMWFVWMWFVGLSFAGLSFVSLSFVGFVVGLSFVWMWFVGLFAAYNSDPSCSRYSCQTRVEVDAARSNTSLLQTGNYSLSKYSKYWALL